MKFLCAFVDLLKDDLLREYAVAHIHTTERRVKRRFLIRITLEVRDTAVQIHNLEIVISEHTKPPLALEESHHTNQHGNGDFELEQSLKNFAFQRVERIADDIVTFRRLQFKEILPVANMRGNNGISSLTEQFNEQTVLSIERAPYYCGGGDKYL